MMNLIGKKREISAPGGSIEKLGRGGYVIRK